MSKSSLALPVEPIYAQVALKNMQNNVKHYPFFETLRQHLRRLDIFRLRNYREFYEGEVKKAAHELAVAKQCLVETNKEIIRQRNNGKKGTNTRTKRS